MTVSAYFTEFEMLVNHLEGIFDVDLLGCFISDLESDVRREVVAQQPISISQTESLAQLQEETLQDVARASRPTSSWQPPP